MRPNHQPLSLFLSCAALLGCGSPKKSDEAKAPKKPLEVVAPVSTPTKPPATKPATSLSTETKPIEKLLLYDARSPHPPMPPLDKAEEEKILSALFPKHLKKQGQCIKLKEPHSKTYKEDLAGGQIVPHVTMYVTGSFTGCV